MLVDDRKGLGVMDVVDVAAVSLGVVERRMVMLTCEVRGGHGES
jgi:hypothetical protein